MKKAQAMVLRQWSYVGDLSEAIKRAARNLLANQVSLISIVLLASIQHCSDMLVMATTLALRMYSFRLKKSHLANQICAALFKKAVREREAHASALGALCLTEGLGAKGALDVYLDMRSQWLTDDLNIQGLDGDVRTLPPHPNSDHDGHLSSLGSWCCVVVVVGRWRRCSSS